MTTEKNRGGRPAAGVHKRSNRVTIHLSDEEKARLEDAALASGLSIATLVRLRTLESLNRESSTAKTA